MQPDQDLIKQFFANSCSAAEAELVAGYLMANPAILDKYLDKADWDNIPASALVDEGFASQRLIELKRQLFGNTEKEQKLRRIRPGDLAIAASVAIVIATGFFFQGQSGKAGNTFKGFNNLYTARNYADTIEAGNWQQRKNNGGKPMRIPLQDGSVITLYAGAAVQFPQSFKNDKREIILDGFALFNVVKNKQQPFIVYSGNLSTTALGTSFTVEAYHKGRERINIRLFTGKILIRQNRKTANWKKDIILSPNEQLAYNTITGETVLESFEKPATQPGSEDQLAVNHPDTGKNEIKFSNTPLPEVMSTLAAFYNIKINYDKAAMAKMNFTGVVDKQDDAQAILKIITNMNGLELTGANDEFDIKTP